MNSDNQRQVTFLVCSPLTERDFYRFGIDNWITHGWKVKVFDITSFISPKFWKDIDGKKLSFNFDGLTIFHNINEAIFAINNLQNNTVFIDFLGLSSVETKLRKAARTRGKLVQLKLGNPPKSKFNKNNQQLIRTYLNPINFAKKLISIFKNKVKNFRAKKYFPDYLVVGGNESMLGINNKKISIIKAHNFDYDYYLKKGHTKSNKDNKFLVFLDDDAAYHWDYKKLKIKPYVTADNYFPIIDAGLDKIAKSLKLNIKIAAHPRSNYADRILRYKHQIIENKTHELINDADVVIAHSSTSLQFAIVMKKPIIIVTTDEIEKKFHSRYFSHLINLTASKLDKKVINLSQSFNVNNWREYLNIDHKKYEKYIENYVKTKGSPEKMSWDIIIEHLEKDLY